MNHLHNLWQEIFKFFKTTSPLFLFFFCILVAFLPRFGMFGLWDSYPSHLTMDNVPLLTNVDGYYYLNNSKDILSGTYSSIDHKRAFPTGAPMPTPAPLLSIIVAGISYLTGASIDWVAPFVPVFLSLLMAIPLYLLGKHFGNQLTGYTAAIIGITAQGYIIRTTLGILDTDCLNPTFVLVIIYTSLQFALTKNRRRYLYLCLTILFYILFLWWWDITPSVVTAFSLWPILLAIIFFYRVPHNEALLFSVICTLILCITLYFLGIERINQLIEEIYGNLNYVLEKNNFKSIFPNTSSSNAEQMGLTFETIAQLTISNIYLLSLSLFGLTGMFIKNFRQLLFFLPLIIVGALSYTSSRFIIFLAPVTALGASFFLSLLYNRVNKQITATLISFFIIIPHLYTTLTSPPLRSSFFSSNVLATMKHITEFTPEDSVIYSWWGEGHPLIFWGERPTLADGMIHDGERTVYLAFPLACDDFRLAANYIQFLGTYGLPGIHSFLKRTNLPQNQGFSLLQEIFRNGPENGLRILENELGVDEQHSKNYKEIISFLFPPQKHPVYLFVDSHMLDPNVSRWIYRYGTWDSEKLKGEKVLRPLMIKNVNNFFTNTIDENSTSIQINLKNGRFRAPKMFTVDFTLKKIQFNEFENTSTLNYRLYNATTFTHNPFTEETYNMFFNNDDYTFSGEYNLEIFPANNTAFLKDTKISNMLITKLFHQHDKESETYFTLVDESPGNAQLWKVTGDVY